MRKPHLQDTRPENARQLDHLPSEYHETMDRRNGKAEYDQIETHTHPRHCDGKMVVVVAN